LGFGESEERSFVLVAARVYHTQVNEFTLAY